MDNPEIKLIIYLRSGHKIVAEGMTDDYDTISNKLQRCLKNNLVWEIGRFVINVQSIDYIEVT